MWVHPDTQTLSLAWGHSENRRASSLSYALLRAREGSAHGCFPTVASMRERSQTGSR